MSAFDCIAAATALAAIAFCVIAGASIAVLNWLDGERNGN